MNPVPEGLTRKDNLVVHTALAFLPEDFPPQLQDIRREHDPAFKRWPPHINFIFPFVMEGCFGVARDLLAPQLATFPAFEVAFDRVSSFPHGTIFLEPESGGQFELLFKRVAESLEFVPEREFKPHLTIAKAQRGKVDAVRQRLETDWKPWRTACRSLAILERPADGPFVVKDVIQLGAPAPVAPLATGEANPERKTEATHPSKEAAVAEQQSKSKYEIWFK